MERMAVEAVSLKVMEKAVRDYDKVKVNKLKTAKRECMEAKCYEVIGMLETVKQQKAKTINVKCEFFKDYMWSQFTESQFTDHTTESYYS